MKTVANTLGVARSNLVERRQAITDRGAGIKRMTMMCSRLRSASLSISDRAMAIVGLPP